MSCDLSTNHSLDNLIRQIGDELRLKNMKMMLLKNDLRQKTEEIVSLSNFLY